MAVIYWDENDVPHAESVNVQAGTAEDTRRTRVHDDEQAETRLRELYPLLCARYLDGYTEQQCARGQGTTVPEVRVRIARELRRATMDPSTKAGPGHALVTMSAARKG